MGYLRCAIEPEYPECARHPRLAANPLNSPIRASTESENSNASGDSVAASSATGATIGTTSRKPTRKGLSPSAAPNRNATVSSPIPAPAPCTPQPNTAAETVPAHSGPSQPTRLISNPHSHLGPADPQPGIPRERISDDHEVNVSALTDMGPIQGISAVRCLQGFGRAQPSGAVGSLAHGPGRFTGGYLRIMSCQVKPPRCRGSPLVTEAPVDLRLLRIRECAWLDLVRVEMPDPQARPLSTVPPVKAACAPPWPSGRRLTLRTFATSDGTATRPTS